jgi:hypothetical protein
MNDPEMADIVRGWLDHGWKFGRLEGWYITCNIVRFPYR